MKKLITILLIALTLAMAALCFVGCAPEEKPEEQPKLLMTYTNLEWIGYRVNLYRYKNGETGKYIMEDSNIEERTGNFLKDQSDQYLPDSVMQKGEELNSIFSGSVLKVYNTKIEFENKEGLVVKSYKLSAELNIKNYQTYITGFERGEELTFIPERYQAVLGKITVAFWRITSIPSEDQPVIWEEYYLVWQLRSPFDELSDY